MSAARIEPSSFRDPDSRVVEADGAVLRLLSEQGLRDWLPSEADRSFVHSLMQRVVEPGKMAAWIAPPDRGVNNLAVDYEYVRLG